MDRTERKAQIQRRLDDLKRSGATEVGIIREILLLKYEEAKDSLVSAAGDNVPRLQGEAKAMDALLKELTRPIGQQTGANQ